MSVRPISNNWVVNATANSIFGAKTLSVRNTGSTAALITIFDPVANATFAELILDKQQAEIISKKSTHLVSSNNNTTVFASSVTYSG